MSNEALTTVYIVRHGQSEGNILGAQQGHLNFPLTDKGIEQASSLAQALQGIPFDEIHASDLARAHETANIIAQLQQAPVTTSSALRERNFGSLEGQIKTDLYETDKAKYAQWNSLPDDQWLDHRLVPGAETGSEMLTRFFDYLDGVVAEAVGKTILVVSHQGMMRNILVSMGWGTVPELKGETIKNTGYIKMLATKRRREIAAVQGIKKREL